MEQTVQRPRDWKDRMFKVLKEASVAVGEGVQAEEIGRAHV